MFKNGYISEQELSLAKKDAVIAEVMVHKLMLMQSMYQNQ